MPTPAAVSAVPPMPYVVASWLGFSPEHLVAGLRRGSIAPPAGAPPGWLPPGADATDGDAAGEPADDGPAPVDDGGPDGEAGANDDAEAPPPATSDLHAAYAGLVRTIDAGVEDEVFDALWTSAGADDAQRAASIDALLWRTVGASRPDGAPTGFEGIDALASAIAVSGMHGTLVRLASEGSAAIAERARTDPAVLEALSSLDAAAFTQRSGGGAEGAMRFDPVTGEALVSEAWIDDRAKFLAWREALATDPKAAGAVAVGWRFVDRARDDGATLVVGPETGTMAQVVFAREAGDQVEGGGAADRLHGGSGDDALSGAAGDDLVEGARGDDTLDGGDGDDVLDGGSGDDALFGGRGDDRLAGGGGHDRYSFVRGDGTDVIDDADGAGEIVLDGVRLDGEREGGSSAQVAYALHDDGAGGTTLVIANGAGGGEIRVRDWRQGMLGIHLDDDATDDATGAAGGDSVGSAPGPAAHDTRGQLKPRITGADPASGTADTNASDATLKPRITSVDAAVTDPRETGNESGSGAGWGAHPALVGRVERENAPFADPSTPIAHDAWVRALRSGSGIAHADRAMPPDVDAAAITASDVANALAFSTGDHDDGDGLVPDRPNFAMPDDLPPGFAPPDAPPRANR
ncbi:MAG: hypothetical protein ABI585_10690 [Betaproteobacteria bacterium]